jgi:hypothetical protein
MVVEPAAAREDDDGSEPEEEVAARAEPRVPATGSAVLEALRVLAQPHAAVATEANDTQPHPVSYPEVPSRPAAPLDTYHASGTFWYTRSIQLLAAALHTRFQVGFRACAVMLHSIRIVFVGLGLEGAKDLPTTLQTVLTHMNLDDHFILLPSCTKCHRLFGKDSPAASMCPTCKINLFQQRRRLLPRLGRTLPPPLPERAVPYVSISKLLRDFLAQPGMETILDEWRKTPSNPGQYRRMMDGRIWHTVLGPDGLPFFSITSLSENEIRVAFTYSLDW